jgi:hypothetical protein
MAVQTIYLLAQAGVTPNFYGPTQLNGSAPTGANTAYGWSANKIAVGFIRGRLGATATATDAVVGTSYNASTSGPVKGTGTGAGTAGDSFVAGPFSGTFAATAWTLNFNLRASTAGCVGHINVRIWKSSNAAGTSATQLLANTAGLTVTLSTTADVNSSVSWSPGALSLNNEYLFFQVEWQETTLGTTNGDNVLFRAGTSSITTADFVAAATGPLATTEAADTSSVVGGVVVSGTLARTEVADSANVVGGVVVGGTLATTEAADSANIAGTATGGVDLNAGLIARWKLSDGSGTDLSGNSNDGVFHGGMVPNSTGPVGNGATSDGTGYVVIDQIVNTGNVSLSVWFRTANPTLTKRFICGFVNGLGAAASDKELYLDEQSGINFYTYGPGGVVGLAPVDNRWHHLVGTQDLSQAIQCIYLDGVFQNSVPATVPSYTGFNVPNIFLGGASAAHGAQLAGSFDEFRVYNRGLNAAEVVALYDQGKITSLITNYIPNSYRTFQGAVGIGFTPDASLLFNKIGCRGNLGSPASQLVVLQNNDTLTEVARGYIDLSGTVVEDQWYWASIPPVTLSPGVTYVLWAATNATQQWPDIGQTQVRHGTCLSVYTTSDISSGPVAAILGGAGYSYFGVDLDYLDTSTGEITGALASTEANDTSSISGATTPVDVTGTLAATEASDTATGLGVVVPISGGMTLDPAFTSSKFALSNGNLTATRNTTDSRPAEALSVASVGTKVYAEAVLGEGPYGSFGICDSTYPFENGSFLGGAGSPPAVGYYVSGLFANSGSFITGTYPSISSGDRIAVAVNTSTMEVTFRNITKSSAWFTPTVCTLAPGTPVRFGYSTNNIVPTANATFQFSDTFVGTPPDASYTRWDGSSISTGEITGALAQTQAAQTLSSDGKVLVAGTLTQTQAAQALSATGTVTIGGALTQAQAAQMLSATGTVAVAGALTQAQAAQTISSVGKVLVTGTLAQQQADQTISATGKVLVSGTLSQAQAAQTLSSAGNVLVTGTLTQTQAAQTISATGMVGLIGTLATTEAADAAAMTGSVRWQAALAAVEAADTAAVTGRIEWFGTLAATETADAANLSGTVVTQGVASGSLTPTEAADTALIAAQLTGVAGTMVTSEVADGAAMAGSVQWAAILATAEAADTAAVTGIVRWQATLATTEAADTAALTGFPAWQVALAVTEAADTAALAAATRWQITLTAVEASDSFAASGTVVTLTGINGGLAVSEPADTAVMAGQVTGVAGTLAAGEAADAASLAAIVAWRGTLAAVETADTASMTSSAVNAAVLAATETADQANAAGHLVYNLLALDVIAPFPVLGTPILSSVVHSLITPSPFLGTPSLTQTHNLIANNLLLPLPVLGKPQIVSHGFRSEVILQGTMANIAALQGTMDIAALKGTMTNAAALQGTMANVAALKGSVEITSLRGQI